MNKYKHIYIYIWKIPDFVHQNTLSLQYSHSSFKTKFLYLGKKILAYLRRERLIQLPGIARDRISV